MSIDRFRACLADTLHFEGGYDDDPYDPGGQTMHGITHAEYDAWRRNHGLDPRPVKQLEQAELEAIYHDQYWAAVQADSLPIGVDRLVFDMGVNCGVGTSIRKLQMALGEKVDGHLGQITIDAAHDADPDKLITEFCALMEARYRSLGTFWRYGKGWLSRLAADKKFAIRDAHDDAAVASMAGATAGAVAGMMPPQPLHLVIPAADHAHDLPVGASSRAPDAPPPASMASSNTGNTAVAIGGGGGFTLGTAAAKAAATVSKSGQVAILTGKWFLLILLELMQTVEFWGATAAIAGAAFIWLERRKKLREQAI